MAAHKYRHLIKKLDFFEDSDDGLLFAFIVNLRPYIVTPGQMLYFDSEVSKGMFIIHKGIVELFNNRDKMLYEKLYEEDYFSLETLFFKTARNWCTAIARGYTDLTILPIDAFYMIIYDFPKEGERMRQLSLKRIDRFGIFTNAEIFRLIKLHSSRSVGVHYEEQFTADNIII